MISVALRIMDSFGRKTLLIAGTLGMAVGCQFLMSPPHALPPSPIPTRSLHHVLFWTGAAVRPWVFPVLCCAHAADCAVSILCLWDGRPRCFCWVQS